MSTKTLTLEAWAEGIRTDPENYNGLSPNGTAELFRVTRQSIYDWHRAGKLDRIDIVDDRKKRVAILFTTASIKSMQEARHGLS